MAWWLQCLNVVSAHNPVFWTEGDVLHILNHQRLAVELSISLIFP